MLSRNQKRLLVFSGAVLLVVWHYSHNLRAKIHWRETAKTEWYGPLGQLNTSYLLRYMPDGETKELGYVYRNEFGWHAVEYECSVIFFKQGDFMTQDLAKRAIERWCK